MGERSPGEYWVFQKDGVDVAGVSPATGDDQPSLWMTYVAVDDADAVAERVTAAGGKVLFGPFAVGEEGRMAVFQDGADGAMFSVWQPLAFKGAEVVNEVGAWVWGELDTRDVDGAREFYTKVFGWTFDPIEQGGQMVYGSWRLDGRLIGGLLPMGPQFPPQVPPNWVVYFGVEDVEAAGARVEELGGQQIAGPIDVPAGRFLVLMDPTGAVFAVSQGTLDPPPGA